MSGNSRNHDTDIEATGSERNTDPGDTEPEAPEDDDERTTEPAGLPLPGVMLTYEQRIALAAEYDILYAVTEGVRCFLMAADQSAGAESLCRAMAAQRERVARLLAGIRVCVAVWALGCWGGVL